MRNIWTLAKREFRLYFDTPLAYVAAFIIYLVTGVIIGVSIWSGANSAYMSGPMPAPDARLIVSPMMFFILFLAPALTMRLISDEIRMGTMELLLTAPVRDSELVIGKWLGSFLFMLTLIAGTAIFIVILYNVSTNGIDPLLTLSIYLGAVLVTAAFLAIGTAVSSMFSNQIAAYFVSLVIIAAFWWLIGFFADVIPGGYELIQYLNMTGHFSNFLAGNVSLSDFVFLLSVTVLGLFVGSISVETRRWR